jgi:mannose-6-phosphate isomerase-like protein (cupin superfamily)
MMDDPADGPVFDLTEFPVHLGLGATVERLGRFTGTPDWYAAYGAAHEADGSEGRLVSLHTFTGSWDSWEMHPSGEELVVCVAGAITLHQELPDGVQTVVLRPGQAVVNPAGVWHTATVATEATALFVTAGAGTEVRAR